MNWPDPISFFAMGGYGTYVWGSMAATVVAVCTECVLLRRRRKTALRTIAQKRGADGRGAP